jgi:arylsulfatase A-like enzyme
MGAAAKRASCIAPTSLGAENPVAPFPKDMEDCTYVEDIFTNHTVGQILAHNPAEDGPLFAFHASHSIHSPLEVVPDAFDKFSFIDWKDRQVYHAMVYNVDRAVGRIVAALKARGMYDDTMIIMTSDNGEPGCPG